MARIVPVAAVSLTALALVGSGHARADKTWQPVQVITGLRQAGLPIGAVRYFTPPGQFNVKANFRDRRLRGTGFDVDNGGSVETFPDRRTASTRYRHVHATAAEYNYLEGTVVLRLSYKLKPAQAKRYERAFRRIV